MSKVIVVGGGPSGMMAALTASKNHDVILIERNNELGKKLKLTGGGRCNITNNRDIEDFFDKIVNNKKFLYSSLYTFTNKDLLDYFSSKNLEYKVEDFNDNNTSPITVSLTPIRVAGGWKGRKTWPDGTSKLTDVEYRTEEEAKKGAEKLEKDK
jgi:ribulose 1,5-bisphosphate synthetase/thiazole synthase